MHLRSLCIGIFFLITTSCPLPGQHFRFDSESDFTDNFDPDVSGPPDGLEYNWTDSCGIQGGGLVLGTNFSSGGRTITLTDRSFPVMQENDRIRASVDFLFSTENVTAITHLLRLFIAPADQAAESFLATANSHGNVYMSGSYNENNEQGYLLLAEAAPRNYGGRLNSSTLKMRDVPTPYLMTFEIEVLAVGENDLELIARLIDRTTGRRVDIEHTDQITNYNLRDDHWRIGIAIGNSDAVTAIDNFRFAYIPFSETPTVTVAEPELDNGIIRLNWTAAPGRTIDLYRSRDLLRWEGPILENVSSASIEEEEAPGDGYFYAIVHSGLPFPDNENSLNIASALNVSSWNGFPHGHVEYDQQTGYTFSPVEYGHIYAEQDSTAEGGYRFFDARNVEIMMQAPDSLNNGFTSPTGYDFRLTDTLLESTSWELFDPSEEAGLVPNLVGLSEAPWGGSAWNSTNARLIDSIGPSTSITVPNGVWAYDSLGFDTSLLLLRQPITIGAGGMLGNPDLVALSGQLVTNCSIYLRRPDGTLSQLRVYTDPYGWDRTFGSFFDPTALQPGTNYLEIYGSYGVAGPMESTMVLETFDFATIGPLEDWALEEVSYWGNTWPDNWNIVVASEQFAPNVPAAYGNVLYFTGSSDLLEFKYGRAELYPEMEYRCVVGKAAADDDEIRLWFRNAAFGSIGSHFTYWDGWYFFLSGSQSATTGYNVGLAKVDRDGIRTVVASNFDTPALADWHDNHGVVDYEAGHWRVEIETFEDTITVRLSERGDATTPAGQASALEFVYVDPDYGPEYTRYTTNLGFESISQHCWIDEIEVSQITVRGSLRIDTGEIATGGLQSLDTMSTKARYIVEGNQIVDRMGGGTAESSANPTTISTSNENWIDYVPGTPLPLANTSELLGNP